jgi:hypothetical protein
MSLEHPSRQLPLRLPSRDLPRRRVEADLEDLVKLAKRAERVVGLDGHGLVEDSRHDFGFVEGFDRGDAGNEERKKLNSIGQRVPRREEGLSGSVFEEEREQGKGSRDVLSQPTRNFRERERTRVRTVPRVEPASKH